MMKDKVKVLVKSESGEVPFYATEGACGADCKANIEKSIFIEPLGRAMIPTGLYLEIPSGYEVQVRPRSGLALKHGITVLNTPGTIDSDYRGQVCVILMNHSNEVFEVKDQMRIAQLVIAEAIQGDFELLQEKELSSSIRGESGFGHTGV